MQDTKPMPHLEIFAGSLFTKRHTWQPLKGRLPSNTCLLITSLDNPAQTRLTLISLVLYEVKEFDSKYR